MKDWSTGESTETISTNWSKAFDFMNAVEDPVVRGLLRFVYEHFVHAGLKGRRPDNFDLLYCFQLLHETFSFKEGLRNAVQGRYGE